MKILEVHNASAILFDGISGNEELKHALSLSLQEGRMPHAIILEGPNGCGKTRLAMQLAKAAVCTGTGERPCGQCPNCIKAAAGSHPDITIVGGSTAARSFHVETIRQIRSDAYIKPNEAARRVFVLLGAEAMSPQAQNALLKVLEEPPETVVFILTTSTVNGLLPTVRSRSQIFTLEGARAAAEDDLSLAAAIAQAMPVSDEALLELTAPLVKDKDRLRRIFAQLLLLLRDASVLRAGGSSCISGQPEAAAALSHAFTRNKLLRLWEETLRAQAAQERNANAALLVTAYCAGLRSVSS